MKRRSAGVDAGGVKTLRIAVRILDEVAKSDEPVRITDLARSLNMTLSSVSRHIATWRDLGYIDRMPTSEAVRLGVRLLGLGRAAEAQNTQVALARPVLVKLRDELNYTVLLSAGIQRNATVVVECIESLGEAIISSRPGVKLFLPNSPTARVIWAFGTKEEDRARLHETAFDFSSESDLNRATLKKKLTYVFENKYDYSVDVQRSGIGSVACPVINPNGTCNAAVTVMMPSASMTDPPAPEIVKAVKRAAGKISEVLWSGERSKYGF
jgi:DNA-binding IclR family transcriptional regulator